MTFTPDVPEPVMPAIRVEVVVTYGDQQLTRYVDAPVDRDLLWTWLFADVVDAVKDVKREVFDLVERDRQVLAEHQERSA